MNASAANLALLRTVATRLGPALRERVVFLGGATTALLVTDPASASIRATTDVDVIVEVGSYIEYQQRLRDELYEAGFREDDEAGAPLCRWLVEGVKVDVMPTNTDVLGFSNRWYAPAMRFSWRHLLDGDLSIHVVGLRISSPPSSRRFMAAGAGTTWQATTLKT